MKSQPLANNNKWNWAATRRSLRRRSEINEEFSSLFFVVLKFHNNQPAKGLEFPPVLNASRVKWSATTSHRSDLIEIEKKNVKQTRRELTAEVDWSFFFSSFLGISLESFIYAIHFHFQSNLKHSISTEAIPSLPPTTARGEAKLQVEIIDFRFTLFFLYSYITPCSNKFQ